jgi:tetratricopeptide (TPR) repeat protein
MPLGSPSVFPLCLRRGVALAKRGNLEAALPCYDQALELDPGNADALVARGAAHANRERWQEAAGGVWRMG